MEHKSQAKTAVIREHHEIFDGAASVLRTAASGDVWQFRMWIAEEKKYVRKTLKTRDLQTAIARGKDEYLKIYSDVKMGKKIFGMTLGELVTEYLAWRNDDVAGKSITEGRLKTMTSQLKHLLEYKGAATKMSELDRNSVYDYAKWRRLTRPGVQDVTIRNEQVTINHMMDQAYRKGLLHLSSFEFAPLRIKEVGRRDIFTLEEYDKFHRQLELLMSEAKTEEESRLAKVIFAFACLSCDTMMRFGELRQLKWSDIRGQEDQQWRGPTRRVTMLVTIRIRASVSKTRRTREIVSRGGEYIGLMRRLSNHTNDDDYIFCGDRGSVMLAKRHFYATWRLVMQRMGIDYKSRNLTWYSLRHFGITERLRAGATIFDVAKIAGTGVHFISEHYGHFDQAMSKNVAMKHYSITPEGVRFHVPDELREAMDEMLPF